MIMALNANSYGSVAEVTALTRLYLQGQSAFNSTTRPTLTEVEAFIDKASGVLNLALASKGVGVPVTQTDARFACAGWVVSLAAAWVELSQPTAAGGDEENPRALLIARLGERAAEFVAGNAAGFAHLGASQSAAGSNALIFTGAAAQTDRADPGDTSLEQPKFTRGQFDS
jgi:hypothetical protein